MEKYVYIKKDIRGSFVEFDEQFDPQLYNNLGTTWEDYLDNKWVLLSEEQCAFRDAHPEASVKEVWDMALTPRTLAQAKREMLDTISTYDRSDAVNSFTINGTVEGWFTPNERSNYRSSIDAAKILGVETLAFFVGDMLLEVTPAQAEYMLAQVQVYADRCYIVTKQHELAVQALDTIEAVDSFDYTSGYPEKIDFTYPITLQEG